MISTRLHQLPDEDDAGTTTVEYAMVTIAAGLLAGVLYLVLDSDQVREWLSELIKRAMTMT
ncbi:MAG: DUF4244 domain-containing protein [Kibdelosporangium sp.]